MWARCLNRTSVGLKPRVRPYPRDVGAPEPQSNQRGIETYFADRDGRPVLARLNRTSVGLKPSPGGRTGEALFVPQSNQRGIETYSSPEEEGASAAGLNRTSVGLKLGRVANPYQNVPVASIEPAWD